MSDSKILASLARVVDVVVDESHPFFRNYGDVGAIRYRLLDSSGKETDLKSLDIAYPMDRNIFSFPLSGEIVQLYICLLYTSPSPRDKRQSRMPSSA